MDLLHTKVGSCIEQTATQKYQSAQTYNSVFSIGFPILPFRHFRKFVLIYLYEL